MTSMNIMDIEPIHTFAYLAKLLNRNRGCKYHNPDQDQIKLQGMVIFTWREVEW
jgi:hypothetical protein